MSPEEKRLASVEELLQTLFEAFQESQLTIMKSFQIVDQNFEEVHKKLDALSGDTTSEFKDVKLRIISLRDEISKINKVTGYEEAINNLKAIQGGKP